MPLPPTELTVLQEIRDELKAQRGALQSLSGSGTVELRSDPGSRRPAGARHRLPQAESQPTSAERLREASPQLVSTEATCELRRAVARLVPFTQHAGSARKPGGGNQREVAPSVEPRG